MRKNFADDLIRKIEEKNNPSVLGIDPVLGAMPSCYGKRFKEATGKDADDFFSFGDQEHLLAAELIEEFAKALIDALADVVPAVKLQAACYERHAYHGFKAMCNIIDYARSAGLIVIADGKRNDIGSSADRYAEAFFHSMHADSLTVNPYIGSDCIKSFEKAVAEDGKGIFALVKTSNPSSNEIQDLVLQSGDRVYEAVAKKTDEWGEAYIGEEGYSPVGAVVGATHPEMARELRKLMPHTFFLIPGYGAQGAGPADAVAGFAADKRGGIVNSSRALMYAYKKRGAGGDDLNWQKASLEEACEMRDKLNGALNA